MTTRFWRLTAHAAVGVALASGLMVVAPATASACPPGHVNNQHTNQCYLQGSAPTINGVPCVASNLGLCSSFRQNQQPPRKPYTSVD
ncbi:hypothetical protein [Mycobacterium sp. M26]|uniref:hypothetical protein n=1 Tax=Mycobacterium sp. M26 TaxID=1762962 RepID=UPI000A5B7589|nr:hypothetical protein [Mycobacterium sp. M26]